MKQPASIQRACQLLRKRVRFDGAWLTLPGGGPGQNDTQEIREATKIYVETWIVPVLDAIESGDVTTIRRFYQNEPGHPMKRGNDGGVR